MPIIDVLLAPGFEEIEAIAIIDVLRRADFKVNVLSVAGTADVVGAHNVTIKADAALTAAGEADAVVLPGGMPGAANLAKNEAVRDVLRRAAADGKLLGAICAAPIALAAAGVTDGKAVTCYPGFEDRLSGATCTGARVEVDGRIVTGKGAGVAVEFALELVRQLGAPDKAGQLRDGMLVCTPEKKE